MVRELAERGVLEGNPGATYVGRIAEVSVPATLQATIAARIDRLTRAKRTLNAAAVIGSRFRPELLTALGVDRPSTSCSCPAHRSGQFTREPEYRSIIR